MMFLEGNLDGSKKADGKHQSVVCPNTDELEVGST